MVTVNNPVNANTPGFQSITSGGIWNGRTLTAGSGVTITNGDGTAGNPVISASGSSGSTVQERRASSTTSQQTLKNSLVTNNQATGGLDLLISVTITPTSTANFLKFNFSTVVGEGAVPSIGFYLFQGTTFITTFVLLLGTATTAYNGCNFNYYMQVPTTAATTYSIYWSQNTSTPFLTTAAATLVDLNGTGNPFGGATGKSATQLIVTEVLP